jgi:hypothetical protein
MITEYARLLICHRGLVIYRAADPGWRIMWNRYPNRTIGIAAITGRVCWSLVWSRA